MKIAVQKSKEVWKTDDGKITIWDVTLTDGSIMQTMSGKIASSIGQTIDVTTRTNDKGKTYLITPPQDGNFPLAPSSQPTSGLSEQTIARFESAVAAFSDAVDRLSGSKIAPSGDTIVADLPDDPGAEFDRALEALGGGEIVDDLRP